MTTDNNWPEIIYGMRGAERDMHFSLHARGFPMINYIRADIVAAREKEAIDAAVGIVTAVNKERELAIIRATLEAAQKCIGGDGTINDLEVANLLGAKL